MMLIPCPHCGPRAQVEFAYAGDATVKRPEDPDGVTDREWFEYIYIRSNPKGRHQEYWQHVMGCRRTIKVLRDTVTHEILASGTPEDSLSEART